jgi:hypothetical protein
MTTPLAQQRTASIRPVILLHQLVFQEFQLRRRVIGMLRRTLRKLELVGDFETFRGQFQKQRAPSHRLCRLSSSQEKHTIHVVFSR